MIKGDNKHYNTQIKKIKEIINISDKIPMTDSETQYLQNHWGNYTPNLDCTEKSEHKKWCGHKSQQRQNKGTYLGIQLTHKG